MQRSPAFSLRRVVAGVLLCASLAPGATCLLAQAAVAVPASTRLTGTVKSVTAGGLTVTKDDGSVATITLADGVRVQQLPAGSTDMKAAQPAAVTDIAEGDRILIAGHLGDAGALTATRLVVMKSGDLAQINASRQQDWQRRGSGGLVTAVDPAAKSITLTAGTRKTIVQTSDRTVFRRYAPGSVKFEDATLGALADIAVGDQLRVRGSRDVDSGSVAAEEVVSGAFRNVAGTVSSVDAAAHTVTLKDLATKKNVVVTVGPDSDLRNLPPEMAGRFAARARGGAAGAGGAGAGRPTDATGAPPPPVVGAPPAAPTEGAPHPRTGAGGAGGDLSQVVPRLPKTTLAELKPGEAVMVVASGAAAPGSTLTAITLLSGVEPLLAASPAGASGFNLSPWSMGGGEAGGTQ